MSTFTSLCLDELEPLRAGPRDERGQFISRDCPVCGCGTLRYERGVWRCDGLLDPENKNKPLEACENTHFDGDKIPVAP